MVSVRKLGRATWSASSTASTSEGSFQVGISTATPSGVLLVGRALGPAPRFHSEKAYRPSPTAACSSSRYVGSDSHHTDRSIVATARQARYAALTARARTATTLAPRSRRGEEPRAE